MEHDVDRCRPSSDSWTHPMTVEGQQTVNAFNDATNPLTRRPSIHRSLRRCVEVQQAKREAKQHECPVFRYYIYRRELTHTSIQRSHEAKPNDANNLTCLQLVYRYFHRDNLTCGGIRRTAEMHMRHAKKDVMIARIRRCETMMLACNILS